jgi:hypothetical protein
MVVYTQDAANVYPNIELDIQLAIDQTNQSYANSNINQRVRLVHTEEVIYSATSDSPTVLERLTDPSDGYLDEIHLLRDSYAADLSMLVVENFTNATCGIAYQMTADWLSNAFERAAFSVVLLDCLTNYTPAHEMGHNMGAQHDRYVCEADDTGAYDYSHGYLYTPDRWRTIMAYNTECDDSGFYCDRIPHWSNPNVNYDGVPTGISEYEIDSADNATTLNNTAYIVANFRESPPASTTTSAPAITTSAPVTTTSAPVTTTSAPVITTSAPVTTSINPNTTTSMSNNCPPNSPINCGNGWCCTTDYPICGTGIDANQCFSEWNQNTSCPMSVLYSEHSSEIELLRYFRDNVLNQSKEGQELVKLYYQWSPVIVKAIELDEQFRQELKDFVDEILPLLSR